MMGESNRTMGTPGPWQIHSTYTEHGLTMNDGAIVVMGADGERVCLVDYQGDAPARKRYKAESAGRDANARLIAAAPELLEALKMFIHGVKEGHIVARDPDFIEGRGFGIAVEMALASLAKAGG
jgi:hypothetical protein